MEARVLSDAAVVAAVEYDPLTGVLRRKIDGYCGYQDRLGYRYMRVGARRFMAHRLIWRLMTGEWPDASLHIDHVNRDPSDNRWGNLRLATARQNLGNSLTKVGANPLKGAHWCKRDKRWCAHIRDHGKARHLGTFRTAEEAHAAYVAAAKEVFGEFARVA